MRGLRKWGRASFSGLLRGGTSKDCIPSTFSSWGRLVRSAVSSQCVLLLPSVSVCQDSNRLPFLARLVFRRSSMELFRVL